MSVNNDSNNYIISLGISFILNQYILIYLYLLDIIYFMQILWLLKVEVILIFVKSVQIAYLLISDF